MATRMQQRRGLAAQWISTNSGQGPVLNAGEIGFEIDTNRFKIGDGVSHWISLPYFSDNQSLTDLIDGAPDLLNTLGELAAAIGDDEDFVGTVTAHTSATTNVHGILDTDDLATKEYVTTEIGNSEVDQAALAGSGLSWDAGAQQFTVDTTLIQERVTGVSDTEIGYLAGVTSDIQTQINSKLASADLTEAAQEAVNTALVAGTGLDKTYDDLNNTITIDIDSTVATKTYADDAADAAQTAAELTASGALSTHSSDTTAHGTTGNVVGTSDIQTLTNKTISHSDNTITVQVANVSDLTATATELNTLDGITASTAELNYVSGVTSSVQNQLDDKAPLASPTFTGTTTTDDLVVDGDFTINGTNFAASATSITIEDNMVQLAHQNPSNTVDLGIVVGYNDGTAKHAGLVKDTSESKWKLFKDVTTEPATTVDFTQGSLDTLAVATLEGNVTGNLTGDVTGNADTATALETARTIAGQSFDGTANINIAPTDLTDVTATAIEINILDGATLSTTELNYVEGVTSAIQDQIDDKAPLASPTFTGTVDFTGATVNGISSYSAPTLGSTSIASGETVTTIAGLTLSSPTLTGTVSGITKSMVGLGNVDNTSDANKPVSTATQTALDLKAPIANPTFTGTVAGVTKAHVGLGNVDNTADSEKPVSTATQTAIDARIAKSDISAKGVILIGTGAGTYAAQTVGTNGQVLTANSAQEDGVEWTTISGYSTPTIGSTPVPSGSTISRISNLTLSDSLFSKPEPLFFAAANHAAAGATAAVSTNGITWTARTLPASGEWKVAAYANNTFVVLRNNSSSPATSTDGTTWTLRTLPVSRAWSSMVYGNGTFVAVAYSTTAAVSSTNGITWTTRTLPLNRAWSSITHGNGTFVAVADGSSESAYSTDGTTWTQATINYGAYNQVTFGNGIFAAVGYSTDKVRYSTNGIAWSESTLPYNLSWNTIKYGNGIFVAMGSSRSAVSTDAITWTPGTVGYQDTWYLEYGGGVFSATGNGNVTRSSTNGITWTAGTMPSSWPWTARAYASDLVSSGTLSVKGSTGTSGQFLQSTGTGLQWGTPESLPSQSGNSGKVLSTDGSVLSWSSPPGPNSQYFGYGNPYVSAESVTGGQYVRSRSMYTLTTNSATTVDVTDSAFGVQYLLHAEQGSNVRMSTVNMVWNNSAAGPAVTETNIVTQGSAISGFSVTGNLGFMGAGIGLVVTCTNAASNPVILTFHKIPLGQYITTW